MTYPKLSPSTTWDVSPHDELGQTAQVKTDTKENSLNCSSPTTTKNKPTDQVLIKRQQSPFELIVPNYPLLLDYYPHLDNSTTSSTFPIDADYGNHGLTERELPYHVQRLGMGIQFAGREELNNVVSTNEGDRARFNEP